MFNTTHRAHGWSDTPIRSQLGNASVTKIRYTDEGKFIVESIGDMSYIEKGKG